MLNSQPHTRPTVGEGSTCVRSNSLEATACVPRRRPTTDFTGATASKGKSGAVVLDIAEATSIPAEGILPGRTGVSSTLSGNTEKKNLAASTAAPTEDATSTAIHSAGPRRDRLQSTGSALERRPTNPTSLPVLQSAVAGTTAASTTRGMDAAKRHEKRKVSDDEKSREVTETEATAATEGTAAATNASATTSMRRVRASRSEHRPRVQAGALKAEHYGAVLENAGIASALPATAADHPDTLIHRTKKAARPSTGATADAVTTAPQSTGATRSPTKASSQLPDATPPLQNNAVGPLQHPHVSRPHPNTAATVVSASVVDVSAPASPAPPSPRTHDKKEAAGAESPTAGQRNAFPRVLPVLKAGTRVFSASSARTFPGTHGSLAQRFPAAAAAGGAVAPSKVATSAQEVTGSKESSSSAAPERAAETEEGMPAAAQAVQRRRKSQRCCREPPRYDHCEADAKQLEKEVVAAAAGDGIKRQATTPSPPRATSLLPNKAKQASSSKDTAEPHGRDEPQAGAAQKKSLSAATPSPTPDSSNSAAAAIAPARTFSPPLPLAVQAKASAKRTAALVASTVDYDFEDDGEASTTVPATRAVTTTMTTSGTVDVGKSHTTSPVASPLQPLPAAHSPATPAAVMARQNMRATRLPLSPPVPSPPAATATASSTTTVPAATANSTQTSKQLSHHRSSKSSGISGISGAAFLSDDSETVTEAVLASGTTRFVSPPPSTVAASARSTPTHSKDVTISASAASLSLVSADHVRAPLARTGFGARARSFSLSSAAPAKDKRSRDGRTSRSFSEANTGEEIGLPAAISPKVRQPRLDEKDARSKASPPEEVNTARNSISSVGDAAYWYADLLLPMGRTGRDGREDSAGVLTDGAMVSDASDIVGFTPTGDAIKRLTDEMPSGSSVVTPTTPMKQQQQAPHKRRSVLVTVKAGNANSEAVAVSSHDVPSRRGSAATATINTEALATATSPPHAPVNTAVQPRKRNTSASQSRPHLPSRSATLREDKNESSSSAMVLMGALEKTEKGHRHASSHRTRTSPSNVVSCTASTAMASTLTGASRDTAFPHMTSQASFSTATSKHLPRRQSASHGTQVNASASWRDYHAAVDAASCSSVLFPDDGGSQSVKGVGLGSADGDAFQPSANASLYAVSSYGVQDGTSSFFGSLANYVQDSSNSDEDEGKRKQAAQQEKKEEVVQVDDSPVQWSHHSAHTGAGSEANANAAVAAAAKEEQAHEQCSYPALNGIAATPPNTSRTAPRETDMYPRTRADEAELDTLLSATTASNISNSMSTVFGGTQDGGGGGRQRRLLPVSTFRTYYIPEGVLKEDETSATYKVRERRTRTHFAATFVFQDSGRRDSSTPSHMDTSATAAGNSDALEDDEDEEGKRKTRQPLMSAELRQRCAMALMLDHPNLIRTFDVFYRNPEDATQVESLVRSCTGATGDPASTWGPEVVRAEDTRRLRPTVSLRLPPIASAADGAKNGLPLPRLNSLCGADDTGTASMASTVSRHTEKPRGDHSKENNATAAAATTTGNDTKELRAESVSAVQEPRQALPQNNANHTSSSASAKKEGGFMRRWFPSIVTAGIAALSSTLALRPPDASETSHSGSDGSGSGGTAFNGNSSVTNTNTGKRGRRLSADSTAGVSPSSNENNASAGAVAAPTHEDATPEKKAESVASAASPAASAAKSSSNGTVAGFQWPAEAAAKLAERERRVAEMRAKRTNADREKLAQQRAKIDQLSSLLMNGGVVAVVVSEMVADGEETKEGPTTLLGKAQRAAAAAAAVADAGGATAAGLSLAELRNATQSLTNALGYLHSFRIPDLALIHGAVEPRNMVMDASGAVRLINYSAMHWRIAGDVSTHGVLQRQQQHQQQQSPPRPQQPPHSPLNQQHQHRRQSSSFRESKHENDEVGTPPAAAMWVRQRRGSSASSAKSTCSCSGSQMHHKRRLSFSPSHPSFVRETGSDMYGLGCALLILAAGGVPLPEARTRLAKGQIAAQEESFHDLLKALLEENPGRRATALTVLRHPFLNGAPAAPLAASTNTLSTVTLTTETLHSNSVSVSQHRGDAAPAPPALLSPMDVAPQKIGSRSLLPSASITPNSLSLHTPQPALPATLSASTNYGPSQGAAAPHGGQGGTATVMRRPLSSRQQQAAANAAMAGMLHTPYVPHGMHPAAMCHSTRPERGHRMTPPGAVPPGVGIGVAPTSWIARAGRAQLPSIRPREMKNYPGK